MTERDDELRKLLQRWEAPVPGATLDARVWAAFRQAAAARRRKSARKWLPVAAVVLLAAGSASLWVARPRNMTLRTSVEAAGFRPVGAGQIKVMNGGE